jgi:hypothetical protein
MPVQPVRGRPVSFALPVFRHACSRVMQHRRLRVNGSPIGRRRSNHIPPESDVASRWHMTCAPQSK